MVQILYFGCSLSHAPNTSRWRGCSDGSCPGYFPGNFQFELLDDHSQLGRSLTGVGKKVSAPPGSNSMTLLPPCDHALTVPSLTLTGRSLVCRRPPPTTLPRQPTETVRTEHRPPPAGAGQPHSRLTYAAVGHRPREHMSVHAGRLARPRAASEGKALAGS